MNLLLWALTAHVNAAFQAGNQTNAVLLPTTVHTVHLVFSHHFDVGLNEALRFVGFCSGFATKIVQQYFDEFIPLAMRLAEKINSVDNRSSSSTADGRFAYTIHPWVASLYVDCVPWSIEDGCALAPGLLRCPTTAQVAAFDAAVLRGDLLWADSPMNVNAGVVGEPSMFGALFNDIAGALNERYSLTTTKTARVWSNVDVPGFTRSSIPLLKRAGATALSVCANAGGSEPRTSNGAIPLEFVPDGQNATMFRWHDPASEEELLVLYHVAQTDTPLELPLQTEFNTYAGYTRADNVIITPDGGTALASYVGADNTGPPLSVLEVEHIFTTVRALFPNAKTVFGSTWDAFVGEITAEEIASLPRYSSEWGDQWVAGMANDPTRLAMYRAIVRGRAACIAHGACDPSDPVLRNFTRFAAKNSEHTQGVEGGAMEPGSQLCIWLSLAGLPCAADRDWKNSAFRKVHTAERNIFPGADDSWIEGRIFNTLAVQAVPPSHPLSVYLKRELTALAPRQERTNEEGSAAAGSSSISVEQPPPLVVKCRGTTLEFSEAGSLKNLSFGIGGRSWSRLMELRYLTYRDEGKKGIVCSEPWCVNPVAGAWAPAVLQWSNHTPLTNDSHCRVVLELGFNHSLHTDFGAPLTVTAEYSVDPEGKRINVSLIWHNKSATRLQEAMTVFNRPAAPSVARRHSGAAASPYRWELDKLGSWVSPSNITTGGEQYQHAVWSGIRYTTVNGTNGTNAGLWISTLDAGLVCPVLNTVANANLTEEVALEKACFDYYDVRKLSGHGTSPLSDAMIDGVGINLHANRFTISGYPQWFPFGIGERYQSQDENVQFRFVIEERGVGCF